MEYNKPLYLCAFLPMAALIYHYAPQKRKRMVLLLADLIFYTLLAGKLTAVFLLTCLFTWWMERRIGSASGRGKTAWFLAGIIVLFGTLFLHPDGGSLSDRGLLGETFSHGAL